VVKLLLARKKWKNTRLPTIKIKKPVTIEAIKGKKLIAIHSLGSDSGLYKSRLYMKAHVVSTSYNTKKRKKNLLFFSPTQDPIQGQ